MLPFLLSDLGQHLVAKIIVFVVCFVLAACLFAGKNAGDMLSGFLRVLSALVYSPFVYLRRAAQTLVEVATKGEAEVARTKQYLLNRFLLILEALLFALAVGIVAVGLVRAWDRMTPPKYLRERVRVAGEQVKQLREQSDLAQQQLKKLDEDWASQKASLIAAYRDQRERSIRAADSINSTIRSELAASAPGSAAVQAIEQNYIENQSRPRPDPPERVRDRMYNQIRWWNLPSDVQTLLQRFNANLFTTIQARQELSGVTEDVVRAQNQAEYASLKTQGDNAAQTLEFAQGQLKEMRREAAWKPHLFLLGIVLSFIRLIAVVWLIGIWLQLLWLGVDIATNVRHIRDHYDQERRP